MKYAIIIFLMTSTLVFSQNAEQKRKVMLGRRWAEVQLKKALNEKNDAKIIIGEKAKPLNDSVAAVEAAEKILFKTYGKENIEKQKPYQIYLINNYWILFGSLPEDSLGGTFLIILDKRDSRVLKMEHGK